MSGFERIVMGLRGGLAALVLLSCASGAQEPADPELAGRWVAEARMPGQALELVLDVEVAPELVLRLSVPAERALGLTLEDIEHAPPALAFTVPHPDHPMRFAGRLQAGALEGTLSLGGEALPLVFHHRGAVPAPPYREVELAFDGAGRRIAGALLLPPGPGPHAALALFHATSAGRRDDLRFLADLAARAGVAALIYERRAVPPDLARVSRADFEAVLGDAEAAVRALRAHPELDAARVGTGGLSQGAWLAALVAARTGDVAFVLALSAPGVPLEELDAWQSEQRLVRAGVAAGERAEALRLLADLQRSARGEAGVEDLAERLRDARARPWAAVLDLPARPPRPGEADALLRWHAHDLDPAQAFAALRVPVLLAFGARDERLPAARCSAALASALEHAQLTLHEYPQANHALLPAPELERDLASWLAARAGR